MEFSLKTISEYASSDYNPVTSPFKNGAISLLKIMRVAQRFLYSLTNAVFSTNYRIEYWDLVDETSSARSCFLSLPGLGVLGLLLNDAYETRKALKEKKRLEKDTISFLASTLTEKITHMYRGFPKISLTLKQFKDLLGEMNSKEKPSFLFSFSNTSVFEIFDESVSKEEIFKEFFKAGFETKTSPTLCFGCLSREDKELGFLVFFREFIAGEDLLNYQDRLPRLKTSFRGYFPHSQQLHDLSQTFFEESLDLETRKWRIPYINSIYKKNLGVILKELGDSEEFPVFKGVISELMGDAIFLEELSVDFYTELQSFYKSLGERPLSLPSEQLIRNLVFRAKEVGSFVRALFRTGFASSEKSSKVHKFFSSARES